MTLPSVDKSRADIEDIVLRFGGTKFLSGWDSEKSAWMILFQLYGRQVRFELLMPERHDAKYTESGRKRNPTRTENVMGDDSREKWAALVELIRAKINSIQKGITTFEREFLGYMVIPHSGQTIFQRVEPDIKDIYSGKINDVPQLTDY